MVGVGVVAGVDGAGGGSAGGVGVERGGLPVFSSVSSLGFPPPGTPPPPPASVSLAAKVWAPPLALFLTPEVMITLV